MAPPMHERRLVTLTRCALAEPPDDATFASTNPTEEESRRYHDVVRLKKVEPDSPVLTALRQKLDQLEAVQVSFGEKDFATTVDGRTSIRGYTIERELGGELFLLEDGVEPVERRHAIVSFVNDDEIVLTLGATRVPMVRAKGARKASEAPSESSTVLPSKAGGASPLEDCERRYLACVNSMGPEALQAMGSSLDNVKQLFEMAKNGQTDPDSVLAACQTVLDTVVNARLCTVK